MTTAASAPLAGLIVLELGQIYNGPYCALLLAHHGAEVIKIEAPQGDVLRRMDRSPGGASYPFLMLNANKRSVRIDLKQPRGRELLLDLAEHADVLVENFAAGVVERLGIDYARRRARAIRASSTRPAAASAAAGRTSAIRRWTSPSRRWSARCRSPAIPINRR